MDFPFVANTNFVVDITSMATMREKDCDESKGRTLETKTSCGDGIHNDPNAKKLV